MAAAECRRAMRLINTHRPLSCPPITSDHQPRLHAAFTITISDAAMMITDADAAAAGIFRFAAGFFVSAAIDYCRHAMLTRFCCLR